MQNPTDGQFYVNEVTRKDGDAPDGGTIAETKTPQANLKLTIPLRTLLHLCGSQYGRGL